MARALTALLLASSLLLPLAAQASRRLPNLGDAVRHTAPYDTAPRVEIALLLDTSSSMDGLLNQAKTKLWSLVNKIATSKKNGRTPRLRVALYEYGKQSLPSGSNQIRQILPLTDDLDAVSEALFSLRTNGGDEYCGQVINKAVRDLEWTEGGGYRAIFIAGNESFAQGPVPYARAIRNAKAKGIIVNTIHCGNDSAAARGMWPHAAQLASGTFQNIDQNAAVATVVTPYDQRLSRLGGQLNKTYVSYGRKGKAKKARQRRMDIAARKAAPSVATERAIAKSSSAYHNSDWDLVDALDDGRSLGSLKAGELPAEMKGMSRLEQRNHVAGKKAERTRISKEIQTLRRERDKFIANARAEADEQTFDAAVEEAVEAQMTATGFEFE